MKFSTEFETQFDDRIRVFVKDTMRAELLDDGKDDRGVDSLTDAQVTEYVETNILTPYFSQRVRQHELAKAKTTSEDNYIPIK